VSQNHETLREISVKAGRMTRARLRVLAAADAFEREVRTESTDLKKWNRLSLEFCRAVRAWRREARLIDGRAWCRNDSHELPIEEMNEALDVADALFAEVRRLRVALEKSDALGLKTLGALGRKTSENLRLAEQLSQDAPIAAAARAWAKAELEAAAGLAVIRRTIPHADYHPAVALASAALDLLHGLAKPKSGT
jgi:hypothetical protein